MDDMSGLFLLGGIILVVAVILVWAFAGQGGGAPGSDSAIDQAIEDSAEEVADVLTTPPPPEPLKPAREAIAAPRYETAPPTDGDRPDIAPPVGDPDDLAKLKGVGPKLNALLTELGVTRFDQIAAWTSDDVAKVDPYLGSFKGRITRDKWIEQAGFLASGDLDGYEARFGKV